MNIARVLYRGHVQSTLPRTRITLCQSILHVEEMVSKRIVVAVSLSSPPRHQRCVTVVDLAVGPNLIPCLPIGEGHWRAVAAAGFILAAFDVAEILGKRNTIAWPHVSYVWIGSHSPHCPAQILPSKDRRSPNLSHRYNILLTDMTLFVNSAESLGLHLPPGLRTDLKAHLWPRLLPNEH